MVSSNIYEFILWDNCLNNCSFCWQKHNGHISTNKEKIKALENTLDFLKSNKFNFGSHILIVGGELFDSGSDQIQYNLKEFWQKIVDMQATSRIGLIYVNTNLLYSNLQHLEFLLSYINNYGMLDRLKFTTSYDSYGRFTTKEKYEQFQKNLTYIINKYDSLKCVINTILTKHFCENYDFNTSFIKKIQEKYTKRTTVNFLPYIALDEQLIPNRSDIFKILINEDKFNRGFKTTYVTSMALNQIKTVYKMINGNLEDCSCNILKCGHPENFTRYSTSKTCFVCDLLEVLND